MTRARVIPFVLAMSVVTVIAVGVLIDSSQVDDVTAPGPVDAAAQSGARSGMPDPTRVPATRRRSPHPEHSQEDLVRARASGEPDQQASWRSVGQRPHARATGSQRQSDTGAPGNAEMEEFLDDFANDTAVPIDARDAMWQAVQDAHDARNAERVESRRARP